MLSPAQRHKAKVLAELAIQNAAPVTGAAPMRADTGPEASAYALLRARLGADLDRLRDIKSQDAKIAVKRDMLPAYADHVHAVLKASDNAGKAVQDEVFVTLMIWQFDVGDWDAGLVMADHVLKFGLDLPERFRRTPATLIAEEPAKAALNAVKLDQGFPLDILQRAQELTAQFDVNDIVRAQLRKALGQQYARVAAKASETAPDGPAGAARAALEQALAEFREALRLYDKIGVSKDIERVTAQLKKVPAAADISFQTATAESVG